MSLPDVALTGALWVSYYINLAEALRRVERAVVSDLVVEQEWTQEPRRFGKMKN
jgi:hypothetical protein